MRHHVQRAPCPQANREDLEWALTNARVLDADGRRIAHPDYVPTYQGTRAVCNALEIKIGKASTWVDVTADGATFAQSQVVANLRALRREWRAKLTPWAV